MITSKSPPNLYALQSPMNMTTMITQHTNFPPLDPPGKPDHQVTDSTANFGPLSKGNITKSMLVPVFDTYLTPQDHR